jgi:methyltransferase (TIGR00027 family)
MNIFVVDHVSTLAWTQVRFWEAQLPKPANVTFLPVDLEDGGIEDRLTAYGFDPDAPSFFSALGVTQYLERPSVDALLRFAATLRPGSEIVFSFSPPDQDLRAEDAKIAISAARRVAALGEPWKTRLRASDLVEQLTSLGFCKIFHLSPEIAQQRYFAAREDGLRACSLEQNICATT